MVTRSDPEQYINLQKDGPHTPGFVKECSEFLAKERDILGVGVETVGTDAGRAATFDPPFPNHYIMHGSGKFGLAGLCNLDQLPPTGAVVIAAPLRLLTAQAARSGQSRSRRKAITERCVATNQLWQATNTACQPATTPWPLHFRRINLDRFIPVRVAGNHSAAAHAHGHGQVLLGIDTDGVIEAAGTVSVRGAARQLQRHNPLLAVSAGGGDESAANEFCVVRHFSQYRSGIADLHSSPPRERVRRDYRRKETNPAEACPALTMNHSAVRRRPYSQFARHGKRGRQSWW